MTVISIDLCYFNAYHLSIEVSTECNEIVKLDSASLYELTP